MTDALAYFWKKKTILSFFAIILIVAIHNSATTQYQVPADGLAEAANFSHNFFSFGIGAVAVPIFFFVSGAAMFRNYKTGSFKTKIKSRIKSLVIPFLIWNIFGLIFTILCTYTPLKDVIYGREPFEPTIENVLKGIFLFKYNFHFWFLFNLIVFVLLSPVIDLLLKNKYIGILVGIGLMILPIFGEQFLEIRLAFVGFYYLGCFMGRYYINTLVKPANGWMKCASLLIAILAVVLKYLSVVGVVTLPIIVSQLLLLVLSISIWTAVDIFIPKMKNYKYYDEFFPIYVLHPYFLAGVVKVMYLILPKTSLMMLVSEISGTILAVAITGAFSLAWHKMFPKVYAIAFGRYRKSGIIKA